MTACIAPTNIDPSSVYPVLDPRRTAGSGPYAYGYGLCWDVIEIDVVRNSTLRPFEMTVAIVSQLNELDGLIIGGRREMIVGRVVAHFHAAIRYFPFQISVAVQGRNESGDGLAPFRLSSVRERYLIRKCVGVG